MSSFNETVAEYAAREDLAYDGHVKHVDGSHTFVFHDEDSYHLNPRFDDFNVVTFYADRAARNTRFVGGDVDNLDGALVEAWDRFVFANGEDRALTLFRRYLAIFHPGEYVYADTFEVSSDRSSWVAGIAVISQDAVDAADTQGDATHYRDVFLSEVEIYTSWARGEVYCAVNVARGAELHEIGEAGGYLTGEHEAIEDSCGGFLGYDNAAEIAETFGAVS